MNTTSINGEILISSLPFESVSFFLPSASQLMEAKAGRARQLQDVDDAGATVENQLPLVQNQLRAMMPGLLKAMYLACTLACILACTWPCTWHVL